MPYNNIISRGTDPTYSTAANEANPLIPVEVSRSIVKGAMARSVVMTLGKTVRMARHLKQMPVLNALPSAYWVSDPSGLKQTTEVDWRNVMLTAEELAALVVVPDNVLADADADIWGEIKPLFEEAIGKAVDEAVLFGINKPASWPTDIKTAAIAAANTVTEGTGTDIATDINNVFASVEADGYGVTGVGMQMSMKARLRGLRSTTNEFIFNSRSTGLSNTQFGSSTTTDEGELFNVRALCARNGAFEAEDTASANAVSLIAGDWSQLYLAIREDINFQTSKHAIIQDGAGVIQYNAWQQDLTIMRVTFRCAYAVPNPTNRLQETTASRFPFGVLRESA